MYYADHLKATQRKDLYSPEIEALWLHVRFPATSVLFAVMYRPPDDNNFFNVVKSYLSNRLQYIVVNGVKSKMQSVSVGIPQGSVLGPTLFALYISDLPSSVPSGETYLFADDTTIYCVADNGDQAIHQLNKALKELYSWCLNNRLTPHPKKSEVMLLSKTKYCGANPIRYHRGLPCQTGKQIKATRRNCGR